MKRSHSQAEPLFRQMDAVVPGWFKTLWTTLNGLEGFTYKQDCAMANCLEDGFYGLNIIVKVTSAIVATYRSKIGLTSSVYKQDKRSTGSDPRREIPTIAQVRAYAKEIKYSIASHTIRKFIKWFREHASRKDWKACLRTWHKKSWTKSS